MIDSLSDFNNFIKDKIEDVRLNKKSTINFVQIGAYDGIEMDDIANMCINQNDRGIFIEPNEFIHEKLKINKENFINCEILKCAIIPNEEFYSEKFYVHKYGGGSTFVKGIFNEIEEQEDYVVHNVEIKTIEQLLNEIDFNIDIFFIDCEGYDHDIVKNILKFVEPKMLYFESWNTIDLNNRLKNNYFTTRDEIIKFLKDKNYDVLFNKVSENIFAIKNEK
jgi:FkbM family methyltransferase